MGLRKSGMRATKGGSRLFVTYALASLLPLLGLGAVLLRGYRDDAAREGHDQGRAQAAVIEEMAIAPAMDGADLTRGLTAAQRDRLQGATDLAVFQGSLVRIRLRSFTGRVVFSDDGSAAGGIPVSDPAFRAATVGNTSVAVIHDAERPTGQVIRVVQPLIAGASGQALGVLELYLPYEAIAAHMRDQMSATYRRLGGGLIALYLVLGLISWSTTRSLRRYAARQEHAALHDGLTGLPNRAAFRLRASAALEAAERSGSPGAIVLIDLNRFKEVNDTLGHHAGDELLQVVSARLTHAVRTDDTVARLGGDEFGLILPGLAPAGVLALLDRVRDDLSKEIALDGTPLTIEASFGVVWYPQHGTTVEELLQRADAAMYRGKRGTADVVVYTADSMAHHTQWLMIQTELRHALERDELVLHYQPKVNLSTGDICGLEALVRWQHPRRGLVPPSEFLPAAEHSGLIEPLTAWVLRRALADQAAWSAAARPWPVAVNVSARNLEAAFFPALVTGLLAEFGTPADRLVLEVTETAMASDAVTAVRAVQELAAHGIAVAVDDFGMGYTSLYQLRTLPVADVKIDRTFITDVDRDPQSQAVVRAVIELAHGLGCGVTAEGVETPGVSAWLAAEGCDCAQGYLFSRPVPWPELLDRAPDAVPALGSTVSELAAGGPR
jgi:diguanylate cyclase (GGDEF)-like protein